MARNIFVSFKSDDKSVQPLSHRWFRPFSTSTPKDYFEAFQELIKNSDDRIYYNAQDLKHGSEPDNQTVLDELQRVLFDNDITVVFISPHMKVPFLHEKKQMIPNEIACSLCEKEQDGCTRSGAPLLAVILPDSAGEYQYFLHMDHFRIIKENLENGYIKPVLWDSFKKDYSRYLFEACFFKYRVASGMVRRSV